MDKVKGMEVIRDIIDTYDRCAEPGIGMVVDIGFNEEEIKSLINVCNLIDDLEDKNKKIKKQQEQLEKIKEYVHQEIVSYTETIRDYIDDDKEGNKHYIGELKEDREHWKDIEKILQNKPEEELYMNWWRYGLYE